MAKVNHSLEYIKAKEAYHVAGRALRAGKGTRTTYETAKALYHELGEICAREHAELTAKRKRGEA